MTETILHPTSSLDGLLERLPPEPHLRGGEFERAAKWFLETDPGYVSELREVWLWQDWPGRWGADIGIDLVAETQEGKLWAIQAKCYDPESQVPTSEVDSFISASSRPEFDHRLLITTGRLSKNAEYKLTHQEKSTAFLLHHHLTESSVDWLAYLDESRPALPERKTPRPHQQKAIDDVIEGFFVNDRGRLIMACGTGKTLVGVWVAERLKSARTLVLVPSLSLVNQVSREWQANSAEPFRALFVCSDQTVADDNFVSSTGELGQSVTIDPGDIERFMSGDGASVVFSTYQSSPQIAAAQVSGAPAFDLVIADEAHHCAGKVDSAFATVLAAHSLKASRRLFMTATPRYLSRRVKDAADQADIHVSSMDDIVVFGPEMHVLTFGQAIAQDLLSDYQVMIIGVTDQEVRRLTDNRTLVELFGENPTTDAESLAALIGILKAIKKYGLTHILTFHSRVKRAKDFSSTLMNVNDRLPDEYAVPDLWAEHVSGNMPTAVRTTTLQKFRQTSEGVSLLSNARCLGEGVDVRAIDGIGFIDPRSSNIDIVQAVGRAIRKSDESKIGTIILPVLLHDSADHEVDEQLNSSKFYPVWEVLNALRAHDEVLAQEIDQLRFEIGRHGQIVGSMPNKISIDIPVGIDLNFVRAIETRIIETTTSSWEFWYGLLQKFSDREGHTSPPSPHIEDGFNLGYWVTNQRRFKNRLSLLKQSRLESLLGWMWSPNDVRWQHGFSVLETFVAREGHSQPTVIHIENGYKLGSWVAEQRRNQERLTPERKSLLESLPDWQWGFEVDRDTQGSWKFWYDLLKQFSVQEGHARPLTIHKEDGRYLGAWVSNQRTHKNQLTPEQITLLENLPGWTWSPFKDRWEAAINALANYTEREGHSRPPGKHKEDGFSLGAWVAGRRLGKEILSDEQIVQLEAFPGWAWDIHRERWNIGLEALQRFTLREGHASPSTTLKYEGYNLGQWVNRVRLRKSNLSPEQVSLLENLPGWVWTIRK